ncbi:hypothetical protein Tco_0298420 [Tanacetum coccineum]
MAAVNDVTQIVDKKGGSYAAIAPKLEAKSTESLLQTYTCYKTLLNQLANDGVNLSKYEINISMEVSKGFQPKFTPKLIQSSSNSNNQADSKFQKDYKAEYKKMKAKLALLEASPSKVSNEEEVTQVKVLMALADDELTVGKSHARNGEWVDIIIRKVNTLRFMDEDVDWQNYLKYINIDIKFVEEQRLNLLSKYNKMLNHALQEQLKEEKKINEKWLTSSKKVSQCISEKIPYQKKKVLGSELLTKSSSKKNENENLFVPASMGILYYMICKREDHRTSDHEMYIALLKISENYKAQPYQYASSSKQILRAKAKPLPPCTHCGYNDHIPDDCRNYPECEIYGSYDHSTPGHNHVIQIRGGVIAESSQSNVHSTSDHNEFDHFKRGEKIQRHIKEPIWYLDNGCSRSMTGVKSYLHKYTEQPGSSRQFDAKADDRYFLGYSSVLKAFRVYNTRRQQIEETYHVTFDESMKAIRFTNTSVYEIGINDSSRYPPDKFQEDDQSRQYQVDSDVSYYIILHGRSLTEIIQENHVPEVIACNEPKIPPTEDTVGPPDLINTEGTHEQNAQNDQMITQPTNTIREQY